MEIENGGPAFPELYWSIPDPDGPIRTMSEGGMTLRDYFAAKAVAGMFYPAIVDSLQGDHDLNCDQLAGYAYTMADALLAERIKE